MANINFRNFAIELVKPKLPRNWTWFSSKTNLDNFIHPVVKLTMQRIVRDPDAPQGSRIATFVLTIIEPMSKPGSSDDALDDKVIDLLNALDTVAEMHWESAERVTVNERNPGYDVTIQMKFQKEDS